MWDDMMQCSLQQMHSSAKLLCEVPLPHVSHRLIIYLYTVTAAQSTTRHLDILSSFVVTVTSLRDRLSVPSKVLRPLRHTSYLSCTSACFEAFIRPVPPYKCLWYSTSAQMSFGACEWIIKGSFSSLFFFFFQFGEKEHVRVGMVISISIF